jgi:inner membrane protein
MPTVFTHAVVGYAAARAGAGRRRIPARLLVVAALLPVVPDLDVLLRPWFRYGHPLGHRGFSHSIAFALILGVLAALACRRDAGLVPGGLGGLALFFATVAASHGVLDAFTSGGIGIPFFMPFSGARYFFPVRPIPASPLHVSAFLSDWGLEVLREELLLVWPFAGAAVAWSWDGGRLRPCAFLLVAAGAAAWAWRLGGFGAGAFLGAALR